MHHYQTFVCCAPYTPFGSEPQGREDNHNETTVALISLFRYDGRGQGENCPHRNRASPVPSTPEKDNMIDRTARRRMSRQLFARSLQALERLETRRMLCVDGDENLFTPP